MTNEPEWINRGKSIAQLVKELSTFEDPSVEVRISLDDGETSWPISIVERRGGRCVLTFAGDTTKAPVRR